MALVREELSFTICMDAVTLARCLSSSQQILADIELCGRWTRQNDSVLLTITPSSSENETVGIVHPRTTFSLSEGLRPSEDLRVVAKFLQVHPRPVDCCFCCYVLVNHVHRQQHTSCRLVPYLYNVQSEEFLEGKLVVSSPDVHLEAEDEEEEEKAVDPIPSSHHAMANTPVILKRTAPPIPTKRPMVSATMTTSSAHPSSFKTLHPKPSNSLPSAPPSSSSSSLVVKRKTGPSTPPPLSLRKGAVPPPPLSPVAVPKYIRFGYLRKQDSLGFWVVRMTVFDSRQRSLIYACFDKRGALMQPEHIYFSQISRVQLSVLSHRQFEIDVQAPPADLVHGNRALLVSTHRFLCDDADDAKEWIALLHRASPRLLQIEPLPQRPAKPSPAHSSKIPPPPPPMKVLASLPNHQVPPPQPVSLHSITVGNRVPPPPPVSLHSITVGKRVPPPPPVSLPSTTVGKRVPPPPPPSVSLHSTIEGKKVPPPPPPSLHPNTIPNKVPPPSPSSTRSVLTGKQIPPPPPFAMLSTVTSGKKAPPPPLPSNAEKKVPSLPAGLLKRPVSTAHRLNETVTEHQSLGKKPPPAPTPQSSLKQGFETKETRPRLPPNKPVPSSSTAAAGRRQPRPKSAITRENYKVMSEIYRVELSSSARTHADASQVPVWMLPRSSRPREAPQPPPRTTAPGFYDTAASMF